MGEGQFLLFFLNDGVDLGELGAPLRWKSMPRMATRCYIFFWIPASAGVADDDVEQRVLYGDTPAGQFPRCSRNLTTMGFG